MTETTINIDFFQNLFGRTFKSFSHEGYFVLLL